MVTENTVDVKVAVGVEGQGALDKIAPALEATAQSARQAGDSASGAGDGLTKAATGADKAAKGLDSTSAAAQGAGEHLGQTKDKASELGESISKMGDKLIDSYKELATSIAGVFAADKALEFAKSTIEVADAYGQMAERMKMATPEASEFEEVQERPLTPTLSPRAGRGSKTKKPFPCAAGEGWDGGRPRIPKAKRPACYRRALNRRSKSGIS